jgi:hypothetical protein
LQVYNVLGLAFSHKIDCELLRGGIFRINIFNFLLYMNMSIFTHS